MPRCALCGSEYPSQWAAATCEDDCAEEARNTRSYFANYNPHRKD